MSSMRSLLLPWRMSGWSMMSVLCLNVVVVSIQRQCISHCGRPRMMHYHQQLVHCRRSTTVKAGWQGWGEEDGGGGGRSSVDERRQQSQEWRRHSILPIGGGGPSCGVISMTTTTTTTTATATTTATMTTTMMWMTRQWQHDGKM
jgi:hypothetical protein